MKDNTKIMVYFTTKFHNDQDLTACLIKRPLISLKPLTCWISEMENSISDFWNSPLSILRISRWRPADYTGGKGLSLSVLAGSGLKSFSEKMKSNDVYVVDDVKSKKWRWFWRNISIINLIIIKYRRIFRELEKRICCKMSILKKK